MAEAKRGRPQGVKDTRPRKRPAGLPKAIQWVFDNMDDENAKPPSRAAAQLLRYVQADPKNKSYVTKRWFDHQMEVQEVLDGSAQESGAVMRHLDNLIAEWEAKKTPGGGQ